MNEGNYGGDYPGKKKLVSLDFIYSDKLAEIENGLKDTIQGTILSKKAICIALAQIKNKELYKQIRIASFKDYLKKKRIPLNYSTALDYSIIGEMLLKYKNELEQINFKEDNSLQKLLLLEKGLYNYKDQPQVVFKKLNETSFRVFKLFVNNHKVKKLKRKPGNYDQNFEDILIKMEDERIFLLPFGLDILWLNMDIERELGIPGFYKNFQKHIINSIKDFFQHYTKYIQ